MKGLSAIQKISQITVELEGGIKFAILHQLTEDDFQRCFDRWTRSCVEPTAEDLCAFIKTFHPKTMCVTEADYNRITKGKAIHASEAEYLAENK
ncbi:hypothetical protein MUK70_11665 [Dyadobacter chenwenxiniae]|uniref:Uncharacterized protein n=1 Tax=Dyadobacter chenwenxiniae TaxID=2906456 RepID=A0A9X1PI46_9BACT|nr:hypothetical protein [Dyadobacter chenwenxiniae]MCF0059898.1 hypothetical protein [Dyadobacter chenwenxiniae]UON85637.1 hypothetical protein MUK70_11665 [Dyadobacter chenwenxiniae]